MFAATVSVKLSCPAHPDFDPLIALASRKCRTCQSIFHISEWLKFAKRSADKILSGAVESSNAPDIVEPLLNVTADEDSQILQQEFQQMIPGTGIKRAHSAMVSKAPDIPGKIRNVRRKA